MTQRNASAAEELASTAEEMSSQAVSLKQLMSFFRVAGEHDAARPQPAPPPFPIPGAAVGPARASAFQRVFAAARGRAPGPPHFPSTARS